MNDKYFCYDCKQTKTVTEFPPSAKTNKRQRRYCSECRTIRHRKYAATNRACTKKRRIEQTIIMHRYKESTPCADCKKRYPYYVMDFDHRDGSQKVADIGQLYHKSYYKLLRQELPKCDLVCANCRRERTFKRSH